METDMSFKDLIESRLETQLSSALSEGKLKAGRGKVTIDIDHTGEGIPAASKKFKVKFKEKSIGYDLSGEKKDVLAYLQSKDYDMDSETIEDLFPELLESLEEKVKTTHEDPIVLVYKNGKSNAVGQMNLSTACRMHDVKCDASKLHKAGVDKKVKVGNGYSFALSPQHEKMLDESLDEAKGDIKTFKTLEDWLMAVLSIKGATVSKSGDSLRANGLGRGGSATFELKKGRGSLLESAELAEEKEECPKCEGEGCDHCDDTGYHVTEGLDKVNKKALAKDFDDRKDKDIDNDGDVDDSDEYLHKRRGAIKKAIGRSKEKKESKKQFMYAAKSAKEDGEKEFVFAGKTYKVEDVKGI